ncbi:MAG TPA: tRNA epoxyqueuosine(34) reductase QueG [Candidatus Latescibacteria bacterium]|jgi:epoxyqueuosine reductase|nr:tRNA epoxyqueuosine(34) reductase QueG [Candidatus Latescibacterota bacterium]
MGFSPVGITSAAPPGHWAFYKSWVDKGYAGEMGYLTRNLDRRQDPTLLVPGARSIVCVGLNYRPDNQVPSDETPSGRISCYARGDDYHDVMKGRLIDLQKEITSLAPGTVGRAYVDTGPVLEREFAARAGLGWFGKHTNLIEKHTGSWFFLGELILTVELDPDPPATDHCGTCTRCIDACPTEAIVEPYVLDSNRCISYLTIELKGPIPNDLREGVGDWVYGCDVCQDVCPWNEKHAVPTSDPAFQARPGFDRPSLRDLLSLDQEAFSSQFRKSPIKRTKRRGLLRNAAVALGNVGTHRDVPALSKALSDQEPLVREHAAWALGRIGGEEAVATLKSRLDVEDVASVRQEILDALKAENR